MSILTNPLIETTVADEPEQRRACNVMVVLSVFSEWSIVVSGSQYLSSSFFWLFFLIVNLLSCSVSSSASLHGTAEMECLAFHGEEEEDSDVGCESLYGVTVIRLDCAPCSNERDWVTRSAGVLSVTRATMAPPSLLRLTSATGGLRFAPYLLGCHNMHQFDFETSNTANFYWQVKSNLLQLLILRNNSVSRTTLHQQDHITISL